MQKILIIRFSSIGDIVLTSPVIRCVKKQLNCKVHFLTKSKYEDLIQHNPYIEKYFLFNDNIRDLVRQLKKEHYTTIIDLQKNLLSYRVRFGLSVFTVDYQKEVFARWIFVNFKINLFKYKHVVFRYFSKLDNLNVTLSKSDLSKEDHNELQNIVKIKTGKTPFVFSCHSKIGIDVLISELLNQSNK